MKRNKTQEIENFVNNLKQSYLSDQQLITLSVNPTNVVGGTLKNEKDCKNNSISCKGSTNTGNCTNDVWIGCGGTTNGGSCTNKLK